MAIRRHNHDLRWERVGSRGKRSRLSVKSRDPPLTRPLGPTGSPARPRGRGGVSHRTHPPTPAPKESRQKTATVSLGFGQLTGGMEAAFLLSPNPVNPLVRGPAGPPPPESSPRTGRGVNDFEKNADGRTLLCHKSFGKCPKLRRLKPVHTVEGEGRLTGG